MILTPSQEKRFTIIFSNLSMEERGKFLRLYEKISTRANEGYLYSSHIKNLKSHEVISIKKGMNVNSKNQELHDFLDELIEAQPQPINQSKQENSSKDKINVPNRKDAEFRIVDCINEFSAQAEILPIEFDRFFYLLGSGKCSGLIDAKKMSRDKFIFSNNQKDITYKKNQIPLNFYKVFFESFKDKISSNFTKNTFLEMKDWLLEQYRNSLSSEKYFKDLDFENYIVYPYYPELLNGEFPSFDSLLVFSIGNRYASGAIASDNYKDLIYKLVKEFSLSVIGNKDMLPNDLVIDRQNFKNRWMDFIRNYSDRNTLNEINDSWPEILTLGDNKNPSKDLDLIFDLLSNISVKHSGSINKFYEYITAPHLKTPREINIHIRKLTNEYSNLSGYGVPLAANFIKDLQLARELNLAEKNIWSTKTAAFCCKPDLHLVNFVSYISGRLTFEDFLKLESKNYNATNLSNYCLGNYWQE